MNNNFIENLHFNLYDKEQLTFGNLFSAIIPNIFYFSKCDTSIHDLTSFNNNFCNNTSRGIKQYFTKKAKKELTNSFSTVDILTDCIAINAENKKAYPELTKFIETLQNDKTFRTLYAESYVEGTHHPITFSDNHTYMLSEELICTLSGLLTDFNKDNYKYILPEIVNKHNTILANKTALIIKVLLNVLIYSFPNPNYYNIYSVPIDIELYNTGYSIVINDSKFERKLNKDVITVASYICRVFIGNLDKTATSELYFEILNYIGKLSKSIINYSDNNEYQNNLDKFKPKLCETKSNINSQINAQQINNSYVDNCLEYTTYSFDDVVKGIDNPKNVVVHNMGIHNKSKLNNFKDINRSLNYNDNNNLSIPNNISKFVINLNQDALQDKLNIVGRDKELEQCMLGLSRLNRHNVLLLGEAGVGKTAIVKALAYKLAKNNVPNLLKNKVILSVEQTALISGAKYRGDLEQRVEDIFKFAKNNKNIILYFDEIHTSGKTNSGDQSFTLLDMIKPKLSESYCYVIASTTYKEYSKYMASDKAIIRRFQNVFVEEPNREIVYTMFKENINVYMQSYNITFEDNIFNYIYDKCNQYINNIKFPDKLFNMLDTCGAYCNLHNKNIVSKSVVDTVISNIANIPISTISSELTTKINNFKNTITKEIIGQDNAIESIIKTLKICATGINETNRPLSSFMFIGSTGVGKTQIAKTLCKEWFGSENKLIRLDMSECANSSDTSKLLGSAPGYVGYDSKNNFAEQVKNNPYCVVLFDEIEKAHTDVINILLQILDEGFVTDSSGEKIDFTNTIIIMTSNCGATDIKLNKTAGFNKSSNDKSIKDNTYKKALYDKFKPEFINRIDNIVIFNSLTENDYINICNKFINDLSFRLSNKGYKITFDNSVINYVSKQSYDNDMGARPIKRFIRNNVESFIADKILDNEINTNKDYMISYDTDLCNFKLHSYVLA